MFMRTMSGTSAYAIAGCPLRMVRAWSGVVFCVQHTFRNELMQILTCDNILGVGQGALAALLQAEQALRT